MTHSYAVSQQSSIIEGGGGVNSNNGNFFIFFKPVMQQSIHKRTFARARRASAVSARECGAGRDTATATLLDAHCRVPLGAGAVLAVGRKWLVMRAHSAYIALGAACGAAATAQATTAGARGARSERIGRRA